ncbi:MAG TPA: BamA/TamA family outer membrane protein [Pyrinomonadaceae bacterium]|nr:BamA/TamA family outer membrane protein [Pyrinomonadaceae bacterium]
MNIRAALLIVCVYLSFCQFVLAQADLQTDNALAVVKARLNLTDKQTQQLRPLLEKRLQTLRKLRSPAGGGESLWRELRDSRQNFENGLRRILNADQLQLVPELHADLENEALARLREQQINEISRRLKLTKDQASQTRPVLDQDFDQKVTLVRNYRKDQSKGSASFSKALEIINEDTEAQLDRILDEKQLSEFREFTGQSKGSLPWLWGAVPTMDDRGGSGDVDTGSKAKPKRGEFVIAPIPVINPTLGNGLALGAGYLYHLDKDADVRSPPSMTGIGAFRTSNGSRGGVIAQKFVLKQNKYRLLLVGGRANIHYNFFGIGADAGDLGVSIPIEVTGKGFLIDASMRVFGRHWFAGVRYYVMRSTVNVDRTNVTSGPGLFPGRPQIPQIDLELRTAGLGPTLEYDSRSDSFYPRGGSQFRLQTSFHGRAVAGRRVYETYQAFYNKYYSIGPRQVLAAHVSGCYTTGSVPFYDLCMLGMSKDLRGYEVGQYIDRVMIASQAEYRLELKKRLGAVAFFGAGEVARRWSNLRTDALKPGGGVGLRFRLTKENHINLRVDYAWGIGSRGLYLGVSEAF